MLCVNRDGFSMSLTFTSLLAQTTDPFVAEIADFLAQPLGTLTRFVNVQPWQAREQALDSGHIHVSALCGLLYTRKVAAGAPLTPLVAPVMADLRYGGKPLYFSDVIVRRDRPFQNFADLRGCRFAINEPGSHSGYTLVRHHLAQLGETHGYFGGVVESGSHLASLHMIRNGQADAAAIDSTVLEATLAQQPALADHLRVVKILGPSPIPPWVVHDSVAPEMASALRAALLSLHTDSEGAAILARGHVAHFVPAVDADYDRIREMAGVAEGLVLSPAN